MNSKTTGVWFVIAVALAAFIFIFQHWLRPAVFTPSAILPGLQPAAVTSVEVIPPDALEIRADRTNGDWLLTRPVVYPAQAAAVEALLEALQKLMPITRITAAELRDHADADAEFGFKNPTVLVIEADGQHRELHIGHKTAPGDEVYLRVVGLNGAFVANAAWLNLLPRTADNWRDTSLVDAGQSSFDWILLTNNAKGLAIELRRDATNHLWRMTRPLQARADASRIADALQRLGSARISQFVADGTPADLAACGLQPADLDLWLGSDDNAVAAVHIGKSLTNDPAQVFAKREGWGTIMTTTKKPLSPWFGSVNAFRDPNLLELTATVAEIEERGPGTNRFVLQRQGSNDWTLADEKFPADASSAQQLLQALATLRVTAFVRDAVTAPDLPAYGLDAPRREIILRSKAGDTNAVIADLLFGAAQTNEVFVRRTDEDSIYAVSAEDFNSLFGDNGLFAAPWQFRDRRIWNFNVADVAQVTLRQNGRTRQILHTGPGQWSLAVGSQGIVDNRSLDQAVGQISQLTAAGWVGRNLTNLDQLGWNTNNLQISVELKSGVTNTVDFIRDLPQDQTALAAVTLGGERWVFVFPLVPYQFVLNYLTIPANLP